MKHSTKNIIALAAIAGLPVSAVAQDVCTAAVTTVTVTVPPPDSSVPPTYMPIMSTIVVTPVPVPSSESAPPPFTLSPVTESSLAPTGEDCTESTSTTTITSKITITVSHTLPVSQYVPVQASSSVAAEQPCSESAEGAAITSAAVVVVTPIPVGTASGFSSSLAISDFVFASDAAIAQVASSAAAASAAATTPSFSPKKAEKVASSSLGPVESGQATFYGGNVAGGMCSFSTYTIPSGYFGTALSDSNWQGAENCGACLSVTGPNGNSINVMVVDQCPGCGPNHLDLFSDAFATLADPNKGVIPVSWDIIPCGITTPITLHNKDGTSQWWFSMQVLNSNVPVVSLEVSTDGVNWTQTERQPYNFFQYSSGFGTQTVSVRLTSVTGETIVVDNVGVASATSFPAGSNFN